ncbi:MAG TPA: phosphotransferase [Pseudonocardiaceae bacterium]
MSGPRRHKTARDCRRRMRQRPCRRVEREALMGSRNSLEHPGRRRDNGAVIGHPVQRAWYTRHGHRPGRPTVADPGVGELVARLAPGTGLVDLGGSDSLNLLLDDLGIVLRVNKPFVSRRHILADQELRRYLAARGIGVAAPVVRHGVSVFRCGVYWAQLEEYVPDLTPATGTALFVAIGELHRAMSAYTRPRPRPQIRTCVSPRTLRRWLNLNHAAGRADTAELIGMLRRQWVPSNILPTHLIHYDAHPDNIRQTANTPCYLDLGGAAPGPRIHDIAYALAYTLFDYQETADLVTFPWPEVPNFLKAYEKNAGSLTDEEHTALAPYTAAVPIYYTVCDWGDRGFGHVARWLLTHPDALTGR